MFETLVKSGFPNGRLGLSGFLALGLALGGPETSAAADPPLELHIQSLFFGDNTEFFGPFRTGQTLAGAWARVFVAWPLSDSVAFDLGAAGRQQFGSEKSVEETRPVLAFRIGAVTNRLILGTLDPGPAATSLGPDTQTPHGLLAPIQTETLSFERPLEAGVQWKGITDARVHDLWISWQRINTSKHRERAQRRLRP